MTGRGRPLVLKSRRVSRLEASERVLVAYNILAARAAGKPDELADDSATRRAARVLRGTRASDHG